MLKHAWQKERSVNSFMAKNLASRSLPDTSLRRPPTVSLSLSLPLGPFTTHMNENASAYASALRAYVHSMPRDVWSLAISAFREVSPIFTGVCKLFLHNNRWCDFSASCLEKIFENN